MLVLDTGKLADGQTAVGVDDRRLRAHAVQGGAAAAQIRKVLQGFAVVLDVASCVEQPVELDDGRRASPGFVRPLEFAVVALQPQRAYAAAVADTEEVVEVVLQAALLAAGFPFLADGAPDDLPGPAVGLGVGEATEKRRFPFMELVSFHELQVRGQVEPVRMPQPERAVGKGAQRAIALNFEVQLAGFDGGFTDEDLDALFHKAPDGSRRGRMRLGKRSMSSISPVSSRPASTKSASGVPRPRAKSTMAQALTEVPGWPSLMRLYKDTEMPARPHRAATVNRRFFRATSMSRPSFTSERATAGTTPGGGRRGAGDEIGFFIIIHMRYFKICIISYSMY